MLTEHQRRAPARLARWGFFLTLFCCIPIGPFVASIGHSQMRRRPDAVQAKGWAWGSYTVALLFVGLIGAALISINDQTAAFEGTWKGSTNLGAAEFHLHRSKLGTVVEGSFRLDRDGNSCWGNLKDGDVTKGELVIDMIGECSEGQDIDTQLTLDQSGSFLYGFGGAPLERTDP